MGGKSIYKKKISKSIKLINDEMEKSDEEFYNTKRNKEETDDLPL